ncbi:MAG: 2-oxoglutarate dehydrogenase, E2 component, dihydrolipoamide succinyltransferase, partial [Bacteroidetes bacterium]|nr:2-oxoglutarate dehydrogenase, E2 component, dihydrolipoamide succinyltransferase [Bacteroidota bacterium]
MAKVEVVMPQMGESVMEGTVIEWAKQVGDKVEVDETLLEIATDKVDTEVPSPEAGVLVEILVEADETVEVGQPIAIIDTDGDASATASDDSGDDEQEESSAEEATEEVEEKTAPEASETETESDSGSGGSDEDRRIEVVMPQMGESVMEGEVIEWLKSVGDTVEVDEPLLEIATDKVDTEVPSPEGGTLVEILVEAGDTVEVGQPIAIIGTGKAASGGSSAPKKESKSKAEEEKQE